MSEHEDPVRLAIGGSPDMREILRSSRLDDPSPQALASLESRLGPSLAASSTPARVGVKLWLVVAAAGVIGLAGVLWWTREPAPRLPIPPAPRSVAITPAEPPPVSVEAPSARPAPVVEPPTTGSPPALEVRRPRRAPAVPEDIEPPAIESPPIAEPPTAEPAITEPAVAAPPPASPPQPREVELLGPAHDALRTKDPQHALDLAARHVELYPAGVMIEEREAIIVEGLLQLGHRDAAQAGFDRFVARFPRSGYRARLQRLLADGR